MCKENITEIWEPIKGYENLYEVSNLGRVKSLNYGRTRKEQVLKPVKNNKGYLLVDLCKNRKIKRFLIHRLVAQTFIPNPENKPHINHIDCNPKNNNVNNLEWCTPKENVQYAFKLGRLRRRKTPIVAINLTTKEKIYFNSQTEAAKELNLYQQNINRVLKGKLNQTGGYIFRYTDN